MAAMEDTRKAPGQEPSSGNDGDTSLDLKKARDGVSSFGSSYNVAAKRATSGEGGKTLGGSQKAKAELPSLDETTFESSKAIVELSSLEKGAAEDGSLTISGIKSYHLSNDSNPCYTRVSNVPSAFKPKVNRNTSPTAGLEAKEGGGIEEALEEALEDAIEAVVSTRRGDPAKLKEKLYEALAIIQEQKLEVTTDLEGQEEPKAILIGSKVISLPSNSRSENEVSKVDDTQCGEEGASVRVFNGGAAANGNHGPKGAEVRVSHMGKEMATSPTSSIKSWADQVEEEPREGNLLKTLNEASSTQNPNIQPSLGGKSNWASVVKGDSKSTMNVSYVKPSTPPSPEGKAKIKLPTSVIQKGISIWENTLVGFFLDKLPYSLIQNGALRGWWKS